MEDTSTEKRKANRAILVLYICIGVGTGLPILLYFIFR